MKPKRMTPSELKYNVEETGSHYFERSSMKFFGDTMRNYGVCETVDECDTWKEAKYLLGEYRLGDRYGHYYISHRPCNSWRDR